MQDLKIAFIGHGNMAKAIIRGLIKDGCPPVMITASSPEVQGIRVICESTGIQLTNQNSLALSNADVVILAVKPQMLAQVCKELAVGLTERGSSPLVISIAAGVSAHAIKQWLGGDASVVRCMPNLPSFVGAGASVLWCDDEVSEWQQAVAELIFRSVGLVEWIPEESLMSAVTAISGSGPAYFYYIFDVMEKQGVSMGLPLETARRLALQTGLGAASMALDSSLSPEQLMRQVMSPKGTTEQAIGSLERSAVNLSFQQAMSACADRATEMQHELSISPALIEPVAS